MLIFFQGIYSTEIPAGKNENALNNALFNAINSGDMDVTVRIISSYGI